jgi:berberine-like enzyme
MVKPSRYPEMYPPEDPNYHPIATGRTMFIDSVDRGVAEMIVERLNNSTAMMRVAQLRVLGGAMARVPVDATAFAHRRSRIMVNVAALYEHPEQAALHEPWVTGFVGALKQGDGGAYVNFLVDEGVARIRDAYPGKTWDRLRSIKRRYDPTNLFRLNQNIPPAKP